MTINAKAVFTTKAKTIRTVNDLKPTLSLNRYGSQLSENIQTFLEFVSQY